MAEQLQALLDRIQTEGVAKAEAEAARIVEEAKKKAADIVAKARAEETAAKERAETEAAQFRDRAEANVRQAARDVVLGVDKSIHDTLDRLLLAKVSAALDSDTVRRLVAEVVPQFAKGGDAAVALAPAQATTLRDALLAELQGAAAKGVDIRSDDDLAAGFRVSLAGGRVEYDFSANAIREEMSRMLRPELAKLLAPAQA